MLVTVASAPVWADDLPEIKSKAAVILDVDTGAEIFAVDADSVRPIASTTKIFVALAVRKRGLDLTGWTEITKSDARESKGGARTRLDVGQTFRNKDLLRAMLMASDNRAPTALGRGAGLDHDALVSAMNGIAKDLHLKRTKFTDPSGLHGNVSTAREMAIALRAALADDVLREIMSDDFEEVTSKNGHAKIGYGTTNQVLVAKKYDVIGGKTGYTKPAGYCFLTGARFAKREVVMAFLGAPSKATRFADFNRAAAWIERGAPGGKAKLVEHAEHTRSKRLNVKVESRGRVAEPDRE